MKRNIECTLCRGRAEFYCRCQEKSYFRCANCRSVMMDPADHLPADDEKTRYDHHHNDVNDPGYRKFVKPLVDQVRLKFGPEAKGLDYGAGPGPVAAELLKEEGYNVTLYDPFYWPDSTVLNGKYNYIICSEVIEHFRLPAGEFCRLRLMLEPNGSLFCMTEILSDQLDFTGWYYKNDPTHVFFYHRRAFDWIKESCGFSRLTILGRLIHFER